MSARAYDRDRRAAERLAAEREALEAKWAAMAVEQFPEGHADSNHHHHRFYWGEACSCGALVGVTCYIPPDEDAVPWSCAACGEEWATFAGPPRHDEQGQTVDWWLRA